MKHYLIAASILVVAATQIPDFIAKNHFNHCVERRALVLSNYKNDSKFGRMPAVIDCNGGYQNDYQ